MPELLDDKKVFSLLEVARSIRKTISERYSSSFWVKAEMNRLNFYSYSGHCYPELVEKQGGRVVAQIKANLWRDDYNQINERFLSIVGEPLKDGIKILFLATIGYDPVHGLSLRIVDIDPSFTLGDLEKEKQETIRRLKEEGLFTCNKELIFPLLPQRLAVISVETSKGYADFLEIIEGNDYKYKFFYMIFPSLLQGERAVEDIISQMRRIRRVIDHFDVVAIIRGGGGDIGLSCYNSYLLAKEIALFPIPVITGIGHATNETVAEMVSSYNAITPTKLAEQLIQRFHNVATPLQELTRGIIDGSLELIAEAKHEMNSSSRRMLNSTVFLLKIASMRGVQLLENLKFGLLSLFASKKSEICSVERVISNLDPVNVLRRGYSITRLNGRAVRSIEELSKSDKLTTVFQDGEVMSKIQTIYKNDDNG